MGTANTSGRAQGAEELKETMTGSWVSFGTFLYPATHIIFDNLGTVEVEISFDGGVTTWKTFAGGSALVLDMRAAHGIASNLALPRGTTIHGNGASGEFSISYIYAYDGS